MRRLAPRLTARRVHPRAGNMPIDLLMSLGVVTVLAIACYLLAERGLVVLLMMHDIVAGWPYR